MKNWKWTIGSAPAAIAPGGVVVLESGYEQLAHRLWEMLNADAGLGRILQEITAASNADLESLPSFVVMIHNGDSEHIAVRGSFDIDLHGGGHTQTISGASLITWSEQRDIRAEGWRIRSTLAAIDPVATEWAASSAVLPVHTLSFGSEGSESSDKEGDTAELSADLHHNVTDTDAEPVHANHGTPVAILDDAHEEATPSAVMMPTKEQTVAAVDPMGSPDTSVVPDRDRSFTQGAHQAPEEDIAGRAEDDEGTYAEDDPDSRVGDTNKEPEAAEFVPRMPDTDDLRGENKASSVVADDEVGAATSFTGHTPVLADTPEVVEEVEVVDGIAILDDDTPAGEAGVYELPAGEGPVSPERAPAEESTEEDVAVHAPPTEVSPGAGVPTNVSEDYPAEFTSGKFFIDSVPTEFNPSDTQSAPDDLGDFGDHAGDTVMVSSATVTDPQDDEIPQILAILCEDGHPNPTHVKQCRVCEKPMSRNLVRVPRPPLGSLIFSTGEIVSLDRDVVVGRRPSATAQEGRLEPRLVALPSPNREISRNHCEIRVDGWDIRIRDLGSNNGTFLTREGQEPLRVGEAFPVILRNGDTIDLGESITIRLEY